MGAGALVLFRGFEAVLGQVTRLVLNRLLFYFLCVLTEVASSYCPDSPFHLPYAHKLYGLIHFCSMRSAFLACAIFECSNPSPSLSWLQWLVRVVSTEVSWERDAAPVALGTQPVGGLGKVRGKDGMVWEHCGESRTKLSKEQPIRFVQWNKKHSLCNGTDHTATVIVRHGRPFSLLVLFCCAF